MALNTIKNYHSISLSLAVFKYLSFIAFRTWTVLVNKSHCVSLKWFQLNNFPIKPKQLFSGTFRNIHIILNVLEYRLTPLAIIYERSETFYEHSNGKYFLDLIWNSTWLQQRIFKNGQYFKICTVLYWIGIELRLI